MRRHMPNQKLRLVKGSGRDRQVVETSNAREAAQLRASGFRDETKHSDVKSEKSDK